MKQKSHPCLHKNIYNRRICHTAERHLKHIMQEQNKCAASHWVLLFNMSTTMGFDRVTFNLSFPLCWLLMSIYKYVCMFSLLQHTIGFPLHFPTWPDGYVPLVALCICSTATNTNRTLAWRRMAWLRSFWWWRTCERPTTNTLWLIKYTLCSFYCSSPSDCLERNVQLLKRAVQI